MVESRMILAGGGSAADSRPLDEIFARWTGPDGKMLYIPAATEDRRQYGLGLQWLHSVFNPLGVDQIDMWTDLFSSDFGGLDQVASVYIGGGNTFLLLSLLRESRFDQALAAFVLGGGAVYGASAGAIVLGKDITPCAHIDQNSVGLTDMRGLDLVAGHAIWCHYAARDDQRIARYVAERGIPVVAVSERAGICMEDGRVRAAGYESCVLFTAQSRRVIPPGQVVPLR